MQILQKKLCLKFLRSRLEVFERESSVFPCHAPEASADFHVMWSSRQWRTSRRASPFLSLCYLSTCTNFPVEFVHEYLYPSPEARDAVSFRLDDVLFTAASDSEDVGPALANALPPSGQEARPSARARGCTFACH